MKNLLKTILFLLLTSTIVSCEWGVQEEDVLPNSKAPEVVLESQDGKDKPPKP